MGIISYDRSVYELVDDKRLPWDISQKSTENRISAAKGYVIIVILRVILIIFMNIQQHARLVQYYCANSLCWWIS